jgi:hypothetical protein
MAVAAVVDPRRLRVRAEVLISVVRAAVVVLPLYPALLDQAHLVVAAVRGSGHLALAAAGALKFIHGDTNGFIRIY